MPANDSRVPDDELAAQVFAHRRALRSLSHGIRVRRRSAARSLEVTSHGFELFEIRG